MKEPVSFEEMDSMSFLKKLLEPSNIQFSYKETGSCFFENEPSSCEETGPSLKISLDKLEYLF